MMMPFGLWTPTGPRNHKLDGVQIPHEKGQFWGKGSPIVVYPMHWIDRLISFYRLSDCLSVCVLVNRSVLERLRMRLSKVVASKPVACKTNRKYFADFRGVRIRVSAVFRLWLPRFSTDQHRIPCTDNIQQCRLCIQWSMNRK